MFKIILISLVCLLSNLGNAYIPKLRTILVNTAEKRSSDSFLLENEVIFQFKNDKFVVKEEIYFLDDNNIYISAKGPNFNFNSLHKSGQRYRTETNGKILSSKEDFHFFTPLFITADANYLAKYIGDLKLVPKEFLSRKERIYKLEDVAYHQESHVRLTRLDGIITYGIGEPSPKDASSLNPHIWIEQDQFLLRKIRASEFSLEAQDFKEYGRGMWYPQRMKLRWGEVDIDINTARLSKISMTKDRKAKFDFDQLKKPENKAQVGSEDFYKQIETFYQLFR